jgi:putative hydrolase of the HAD superfamily
VRFNKYILWDCDGTLGFRQGGMWGASMIEAINEVDPHSCLTAPDFRPFLSSGFPWHDFNISHTHLKTSEQWWEPLLKKFEGGFTFHGFSPEVSKELAQKTRLKFIQKDKWSLFEDTEDTLNLLLKQGWSHLIVSNHIPELEEIIDHLGIMDYFDFIVNSAKVGYEKPHPEIFKYALKLIGGVNDKEIWMVGDNIEADVIGAESMGLKSILVRNQDKRAKYNSPSLNNVIDIIKS